MDVFISHAHVDLPLAQYPNVKAFISHWCDVRAIMRAIQDELVRAYKLVDVTKFQEKL